MKINLEANCGYFCPMTALYPETGLCSLTDLVRAIC